MCTGSLLKQPNFNCSRRVITAQGICYNFQKESFEDKSDIQDNDFADTFDIVIDLGESFGVDDAMSILVISSDRVLMTAVSGRSGPSLPSR